ncbi:hypothetical protein [Paenibacillus wenxiniae]|uniref:Uncharacterized protein n=1 Tax=Paenibacillus wenxiniae TaxID=1636843 RepID=A0ABW4RPR6_9BACL
MVLNIKAILNVETEVTSLYTPSIKTFNIVTERMSDNCLPIIIGEGICIWLTPDGALGEIECIYPNISTDLYSPQIQQKVIGTPLFYINDIQSNGICVKEFYEGFIICFSSENEIEIEVIQGNISYFFTQNILVAIGAKRMKLIKD